MMMYVEQEGRTALMLACWEGYLETVNELLRAGDDKDTQDQVCVCMCVCVCVCV